ncbi:hypothetical protein ACINK0_15010 [Deinococcus sp. VB343]|uniref:Uncharacterized protein n=1 Tax=Deinococcus sp. VB142 TaxID=3112952 RepID=A0AAU6Q7T2_9DEIO
MRKLTFILLGMLSLSVASAARLTASQTVPGHSAGSFGSPGSEVGDPSGGVAWSADGQRVYTLDTTGRLLTWEAQTGKLLAQRQQQAPVGQGKGLVLLTLNGWQSDRLRLQARSFNGEKEVNQDFTADPVTGKTTLLKGCSAGQTGAKDCPQTKTVRLSGDKIVRQLGTEKATVTVPAGLKVGAVALGQDGSVAALAVKQPDKYTYDGPAYLLLWDGETLKSVSLGTRLMSLQEGQLAWTAQGWLFSMSMHDMQTGGIRSDGQMVALYTVSGKRVWDTSPQVGLRGVWPSPDGQTFLSIRDGSLPEVRRLSDGAFVRGLGEAVVAAVPVRQGQALLALNSGGGKGRIALSGPSGLKTLSDLNVDSLAVNNDATRFLSSTGNTIRLHDFSGKVLQTVQAKGEVRALAFTGDNQSFSAAVVLGQDYGSPVTAAWTLAGGSLKLPKDGVFPLTSPVITRSQDQNGPQQSHRERLTAWQNGKSLWQSAWRVTYRLSPSADGRWLAVSSQSPNSKSDPVQMDFFRLNVITGKPSKTLTVAPTTKDPNSAQGIAALSRTGQYALILEGTGDACGWGLYGFRLSDLSTGRVLPTPKALGQGYQRFGGCGYNVPFVKASFAPDNSLLLQDGNRLDWWQVP